MTVTRLPCPAEPLLPERNHFLICKPMGGRALDSRPRISADDQLIPLECQDESQPYAVSIQSSVATLSLVTLRECPNRQHPLINHTCLFCRWVPARRDVKATNVAAARRVGPPAGWDERAIARSGHPSVLSFDGHAATRLGVETRADLLADQDGQPRESVTVPTGAERSGRTAGAGRVPVPASRGLQVSAEPAVPDGSGTPAAADALTAARRPVRARTLHNTHC